MSRDILISLIDPNPDQARKLFDEEKLSGLAESISANGLAVPILIRPNGERYTIVHGERRFRAVRLLGWQSIPAEIRDLSEDEARWLSLVENIQRADLSPIEEAEAYRQELDKGLTQTELSKRIGKSQSYIAHKIQLLSLPMPIKFYLDHEAITEGHVRQILRLKGIYGENITESFEVPEGVKDIDKDMPETVAWQVLAFCILRDIRPEDNPLAWFMFPQDLKEGSPFLVTSNQHLMQLGQLVAEACKVYHREVINRGMKLPVWEVKAFWWSSFVVYAELSVADLDKHIDRWVERLYSGIAYLLDRSEPIDKDPQPFHKLQLARWWGHHSDVRHAGLSEVIEHPEKYDHIIETAIMAVLKSEFYYEPSSLQPWGTAHEKYKDMMEQEREHFERNR